MENDKAPTPVHTSEAPRIDALKAKYRSEWDTHQIIADDNARLCHAGKQPSYEQLSKEQSAAKAVRRARDALRRELAPRGPRASV